MHVAICKHIVSSAANYLHAPDKYMHEFSFIIIKYKLITYASY